MKSKNLASFLFGVLIIVALAVSVIAVAGDISPVSACSQVCPDGGCWTKVDSGDLSLYPVDGATEYCFKAGNWNPINYIPDGGFGQDGPCNESIENCDLSHWSYKRCEQPTETVEPTPTDTLVPTEDPTEEPTPIPSTETPEITETPEPTPVSSQCTWKQYILVDTRGRICYLKRNFERGDQPNQLPDVYDNTGFMRELCSKTCTGKELPQFGQLDKFSVTCAECGEACK